MDPLRGEAQFQEWVQQRLVGMQGHFEDHRFSQFPFVPDLSCAAMGQDYWLELKYAEIKLLHAKYDDFALPTLQRGQLEWLRNRQRRGRSICGILAYIVAKGDYGQTPYIFFMTAELYLKRLWKKKVNGGGVLLGASSAAAHSISTGRDLFAFIQSAARGGADNGWALSV